MTATLHAHIYLFGIPILSNTENWNLLHPSMKMFSETKKVRCLAKHLFICFIYLRFNFNINSHQSQVITMTLIFFTLHAHIYENISWITILSEQYWKLKSVTPTCVFSKCSQKRKKWDVSRKPFIYLRFNFKINSYQGQFIKMTLIFVDKTSNQFSWVFHFPLKSEKIFGCSLLCIFWTTDQQISRKRLFSLYKKAISRISEIK